MAPGILMIVVGAIFAFAVKGDTKAVDLQTMGVILMLGGVAIFYQARLKSGHLRETRVIDDMSDPDRAVHIVREYVSDDERPEEFLPTSTDAPSTPVDAEPHERKSSSSGPAVAEPDSPVSTNTDTARSPR